MFEFMKEIKDLKKAELWGVVIIAGFNLSAIITALTNVEKLGVNNFFTFFVLLQACISPIYIFLFRFYASRLGVDDIHETARNIHTTMEKTNELARITSELVQASQRVTFDLSKQIELLRQLPPCITEYKKSEIDE